MKHFFLLLFCFTSPLIAGPENWLEAGLLTPEMITSVKPELGLTQDQEEKMTTLVKDVMAEAEPVEKQVREHEKELTRLLRQPTTTAAEAEAALTPLLAAEAEVKKLRLRTLLALRDVLTPEQQAKAVNLAPSRQGKRSSAEAQVKEKAQRLKTAVDALGVPPTQAMQARGQAIVSLMRAGDYGAAGQALDELILESELDQTATVPAPDFSQFSPGDTDLTVLKQRYTDVEVAAQSIVSIPLVRRLIEAKTALEAAKIAEDAEQVGRILTWAEEMLKK
ncbi:periplasmic heavy metal sensor [Prosthecobacter dejongeii]|uniref:Spy/CpxP family protein refolding chaperone n=1 Tax=Prosthecobacter dejongeii TaxID=48465 RepID=A0A7W8DPT3_9BACT|nr:periplasmic heavy metal sensor [Prosthecobacter dejongeii]MBB5037637.1 Spy/CpxP family protein refolding chaperone [Prosthecobacter dejongeii]